MDDKRIRIVAIEDHALLLEAMGSFTNARDDMTLVAAERSARRGLQAIADSKPDVAIIAIPLSDMNGLVLAGRIINDHPATKVVILSMHEDRALVQQALQIGVKGYVSKRSPVEHLLQAITATAEGARYIDPAIASKILGSPDDNRSSKEPPDAANLRLGLTKREADTVRLIALGYTAKEVAAQLGVSVKSVETVKSRASEKLDLRTRAQLVRYAATQGWLETVTA